MGGSPIASLLLGYPTQITRATLFGTFGLRGWEHSAYVQDDFKLSRRLTLNLGLRYELFLPLTEAAGRLANFNFDPVNPAVSLIPALGGTDGYAGRKVDTNNFAPRVGFAYLLTPAGTNGAARLLRHALHQRALRRPRLVGPQRTLHAHPEFLSRLAVCREESRPTASPSLRRHRWTQRPSCKLRPWPARWARSTPWNMTPRSAALCNGGWMSSMRSETAS